MRGFEFADTPDRPVTGTRHASAGRTDDRHHPSRRAAHSAGDLMVWLPKERVLFAGDLLIEDGVTMVVDGSARGASARPATDRQPASPGSRCPGTAPSRRDPRALVARTRAYITGLEADMRAAVEHGVPMQRALAALPPADENRPVSLNSRRRRNAARVYVEEERAYMGLEDSLP